MANRAYLLTAGAAGDIREIAQWSLQRWGKEQTLKYLGELHAGLEYIAANLAIVKQHKSRDALSGGSGLMLYPINQHYAAFVPIAERSIAVAAIIRQGRDIAAILQKDRLMIDRDIQEIHEKLAAGLIAASDE